MYRHMEGYTGDNDADKIFICLSNTAWNKKKKTDRLKNDNVREQYHERAEGQNS